MKFLMKMQEEKDAREGKIADQDKYLDDPAIVEHKDDSQNVDELLKQKMVESPKKETVKVVEAQPEIKI